MKDFGVRYTIRGIARLIGVADVDWAADEELKIRESQSVGRIAVDAAHRRRLILLWLLIIRSPKGPTIASSAYPKFF
ncbi:hypothetical protein WN944_011193 [Citrus x changshan-huyou]|uniref:Uncharacterized protein n=1 Tax=Citrus x changshan-huyou TaxID=2935761 RepID=A0AAP0MVI2_9ROSI